MVSFTALREGSFSPDDLRRMSLLRFGIDLAEGVFASAGGDTLHNQLDLLAATPDELPPVARRSDPTTSHLAAASHTRSGGRATNLDLVLAVVRRTPGLTYREIHTRLPMIREAVEVQRRCDDLRKLGKIKPGPSRPCIESGRQAQTWCPVER